MRPSSGTERGAADATLRSVFLAVPISNAEAETTHLADAVASDLLARGWQVVKASPDQRQPSYELNFSQVNGVDALVALVPPNTTPVSSLWIEVGMALAWRKPMLLVGEHRSDLPVLAAQALASPAEGGVAHVGWLGRAALENDMVRLHRELLRVMRTVHR